MTCRTRNTEISAADPFAAPLVRANATLVRYPRFNKLHDAIRLCQSLSQIAGEPQCMVLEGAPGVGKSTLVKSYAETFLRRETPNGTKVPVFYVETPAPVTVKGMASKLLDALGDPMAHYGTLWSMNGRLITLIQACEVQLVILDDFHHLLNKDTNRIMQNVSDWLKVLIKETNVPFLIVGIVDTVRHILEANAQLSRLVAIRETLQPFCWNTQKPETIKEFAGFVAFAENKIGIPLAPEVERMDLLCRLYDATNGIAGNVMNLLRYSVVVAQQQKCSQLSLDVLSNAFDLRLAEHLHKKNPFTPS